MRNRGSHGSLAHVASFEEMTSYFGDDDFRRTALELDEPQLTDYDLFTDTRGIKIYRHCKESGLYEYKTYGVLNEIDPLTMIQVYCDYTYRSKWDSYVVELKELTDAALERGSAIYWCVKYPFPLTNRDYVFMRETREISSEKGGHVTHVSLSKDMSLDAYPPKSKYVRVDDFYQAVAVRKHELGTEVFMHYYDNPKGMIPKWIINWVVKTAAPSWLKTLEDACKKYKT
ncbi:phosphatidylcholine transfer protein-like [Oscarella lobularis]|uniref:phosphatidylcholine transfer protein-like n=1 Tax=Oscarella lobularis TaxID=121494 RepID=UPI0033134F1A